MNKKNIMRIFSMALAVVLLLSAAACTVNVNVTLDKEAVEALKSVTASGGSVQVNANTQPVVTPPTTAASEPATVTPTVPDSTVAPSAGDTTDTTAPASTPAASSAIPQGNAEILAKYGEVVNQMKGVDKPGYYKVEWQSLPEEYRKLGKLGNVILGAAGGFMTDEATARGKAAATQPGSDMGGIPVYDNAKSCLMTDPTGIKSATCTANADGTNTIVIVLNDEKNPEPAAKDAASAPSITGGIFPPMSRASIDETISGISVVTVNSFELNYTDCTATVTYDPSNNHVTKFEQIMNVDITANVTGLKIVTIDGSARLVNTMIIDQFVYA